MDIQFVDYDNVRFHLSTAEAKTVITLSMAIQCWPDLVKYGARDHLQSTYGEYLLGEGETEPEYNVSLRIDLEKIPSGPGTSSHCLNLRSDLSDEAEKCRRTD
jgi:actin related protein 2/3 complex subunit 2